MGILGLLGEWWAPLNWPTWAHFQVHFFHNHAHPWIGMSVVVESSIIDGLRKNFRTIVMQEVWVCASAAGWKSPHCWTQICRWRILYTEQWQLHSRILESQKYLPFRVSYRLYCGFRYIYKWPRHSRPWDWCWLLSPSDDLLTPHVTNAFFILAFAALTWSYRRTCDSDNDILKYIFLCERGNDV